MTMTDTGDGERGSKLELWLWGTAALASLGLHAGGAAWLLGEPPMKAFNNMPPAAIMIELAPEPEAVNTEMNEISPDQENAEASPEQMEQPVETPVPEEIVEERPPEEQVGQQVLTELENVEVPIPVVRPKPPERREVADKDKPTKEPVKRPPKRQASNASQERAQAQAQATQSNRNAARQTASGLSSSMTPARWQSRLMAHLERRKKYPSAAKSRREQGTVYVRFRIDDAGKVLSASLARSSGYPELDAEVVALVKRASPVPAPPPGVNRTITAPVKFDIR